MNANTSTNDVPISRPVRFGLLLCFDIPAVICTLFLLYHLLFTRALRQALHNHVIILLLLNTLPSHLIDISSYIHFLTLGYVWPSTPSFCSFWLFVDVGLFDMIAILMAWAAIERHILIFHNRWIQTQRQRFLLHYLPLTLIIVYTISFYVFVIFFPPCENLYDYSQPWCSYPCYYDYPSLAVYDIMVNCDLPVLTIIVFSIALIIRYVRQKHRVRLVIH